MERAWSSKVDVVGEEGYERVEGYLFGGVRKR